MAKIEFDSATEHSYSSVWRWFSVFLSLQFHSATEHSYSTALFCYRALVFYCLTLQQSTLEFDSASVRSYSTVWLCYRALILHSFILPQSTRFPQFDSATTTVARALNFDSATERLCSTVWLCYRALFFYSLTLLQSELVLYTLTYSYGLWRIHWQYELSHWYPETVFSSNFSTNFATLWSRWRHWHSLQKNANCHC